MNDSIPLSTATLPVPTSISRSPLRRGFPVVLLAFALALFALSATAQAQDGDVGNDNTAEGTDALHTYITTATSAASNTAIGFSALYHDTSGGLNTAVGAEALDSNTTGVENTASGAFALEGNRTGNFNTAAGFDALVSNGPGNNNTANGCFALADNTGDNRARKNRWLCCLRRWWR